MRVSLGCHHVETEAVADRHEELENVPASPDVEVDADLSGDELVYSRRDPVFRNLFDDSRPFLEVVTPRPFRAGRMILQDVC